MKRHKLYSLAPTISLLLFWTVMGMNSAGCWRESTTSGDRKAGQNSASSVTGKTDMGTRKQVYNLTRDDFELYPVWEFALDEEGKGGQNEATVRPYDFSPPLDPAAGMFVVSTDFTLADGTKMKGYLTPQAHEDFKELGYIQPHIITDRSQVMFWFGMISPDHETIAGNYRKLSKSASKVFPLEYRSAVNISGGPVSGVLTGFFYEDDEGKRQVK